MRTAAAANVDAVLLSPDTVEAFNPKVVRAGMGAHFRLPIESLSWDEIKELTANLKIYLADAQHGTRTTQYDLIDWTQPCALIISSEAEGASDEAKALTQESVYIPMQRNVESLNAAVAGSIILFEAVRQRAER
ncbi:MAG: RNA methyltransferase [Chloroflexi bacterium]|nr:RNA methyltransferase [Chloroflexota bacterium]